MSPIRSERPAPIAFIVTNYPPRNGGVEAHVSGLARALVERGHLITVITLDEQPSDSVEEGIRVVRLPRRFPVGSVLAFPPLGSRRRIRDLLRESGAEVISTHTRFFPMSYLGVRLGRSMGIPVIHTEHGSGFVAGVSPLIALASRVIDMTMGRFVLRRATRVVGVSRGVVAFVEHLSGVKASVFPNAIDVHHWRSAAAASTAVQSSGARLVFVGRLVPGKGWEATLKAAETLAAFPHNPQFELHFCGDGPLRDELEKLVQHSAIGSRVTVHGRVGISTLSGLLRESVLVNPTELSEGFQTTLLEALACGASIVSSDVPGVPELVELGAPIVVVHDQEPVSWAAAIDGLLRMPPVKLPDDKVNQWSWPARALQYQELVEQVLTASARDTHT